MAYKNYRNDYDNLNSWLSRVPNYEPRETDDIRQVETKLKNQRVRVMQQCKKNIYKLKIHTKCDIKINRFGGNWF